MYRNGFLPNPRPEPQSEATLASRLEVLRQRVRHFYARFHNVFFLGVGVLVALMAMVLYDMTKAPPQHLTQRDIDAAVERALDSAKPKPSLASQAYEIIRPSLVQVEAVVSDGAGKEEKALGSGVAVNDRGAILTSLHVVENASEIHVVFADGSESEASVVTRQPENDMAVLQARVVPDDLVPATLSSSSMLNVGDEVFAVGNPFGISDSLSAGVVSGLGRNYRSPKNDRVLRGLVQFDAAVNPGNSGGPLVNRDGEVVGIVVGLANPTGGDFFIGIGFAVPIETAGGAAGAPPL